jgi:hypothetical protein
MFRMIALSICLSATPALAQERQWLLDTAGEDAFLAFGVPNTTDIGVSFWCKIGKTSVSLFTPVTSAEARPKLVLSVGMKDYRLTTKVSNNDGARTIEAPLKPQKQILDILEASESFSVMLGKHKVTYPLGGADFEGLLKLCHGTSIPANN